MSRFRQMTMLAGAAALAGSVVVSIPANAAVTPVSVCGGGSYHVIGHHDLDKSAVIYLMYNGSTDCVVTWKTKNVGTRTHTQAWIVVRNGTEVVDSGQYKFYAGPVKAYAPGMCIRWGGASGDVPGQVNSYAYSWYSGWGYCT